MIRVPEKEGQELSHDIADEECQGEGFIYT